MSGRYYDETEESLKRLNDRRKVLEHKTALRIATMNEFRVVKSESLARLQKAIATQNIAAKERNTKLLQEIGAVSITAINNSTNRSRSLFGVDHTQKSQIKDKLAEAKKNYHKKIETLLPQYRQDSIRAYESEIAKTKAEKRIVEERRSVLQHELQKEEMIKGYLEQERRGLSLSLALEQQDILHAHTASILRQQEGEAIDAAIEFHIDSASDEYKDILAARNKSTFRQAHEQVRSLFHPTNPPSFSSSSSVRGRERGRGGGEGRPGDQDYGYNRENGYDGVGERGGNSNSNSNSNSNDDNYDKDGRGGLQGYDSKANHDRNIIQNYRRSEFDDNDDVKRRDKERDSDRDTSNNNNVNYHGEGTYRGVHDIAPSVPPSVYRSSGNSNNTFLPPYPYSENGKTVSNNGFREVIDIERDTPDGDGKHYGQIHGRELVREKEKEKNMSPRDNRTGNLTNMRMVDNHRGGSTNDTIRENSYTDYSQQSDCDKSSEKSSEKSAKSLGKAAKRASFSSPEAICNEASSDSGSFKIAYRAGTGERERERGGSGRKGSGDSGEMQGIYGKEKTTSNTVNSVYDTPYSYGDSMYGNLNDVKKIEISSSNSMTRDNSNSNSNSNDNSYDNSYDNVSSGSGKEKGRGSVSGSGGARSDTGLREREMEREREKGKESLLSAQTGMMKNMEKLSNKNESGTKGDVNMSTKDDSNKDEDEDEESYIQRQQTAMMSGAEYSTSSRRGSADASASASNSRRNSLTGEGLNAISSNVSNLNNNGGRNSANSSSNGSMTNSPITISQRDILGQLSMDSGNHTAASISLPGPLIGSVPTPPPPPPPPQQINTPDLTGTLEGKGKEVPRKLDAIPLDFFTSISLAACTKILTVLTATVVQSKAGGKSEFPAKSYGKIYGQALIFLKSPLKISDGFIQGAEKSTNMTQIYKTLLLARIKTGIKSENEEEKSVILRGLEDVQLTEINVLVIAAAVLCLCKEMGSEIMPLDALNGVVTLDRLKKSHKKKTNRSELWSSVVSHLRSLIELDPSSFDELSRCFTEALINHVNEEEKSRIERKASKLLQLAILPDDDLGASSLMGSPLRRSASSQSQSQSQSTSPLKKEKEKDSQGNSNSNINSMSMSRDFNTTPLSNISNDSHPTNTPTVSTVRTYTGHNYGVGEKSTLQNNSYSSNSYSSTSSSAVNVNVAGVGRHSYSADKDNTPDNAGNNFTSSTFGSRPGSVRYGTESVPGPVQEPSKGERRERNIPSSNVKYSVRMKASELDEEEFEEEDEMPPPPPIPNLSLLTGPRSSQRSPRGTQNNPSGRKNIQNIDEDEFDF